MPDWSYQTIFRPLLFQLPSRLARDFTLRAMGMLSRVPGGSFIIRTMGHMEASPILATKLAGIPLKYPVGLSGGLDPEELHIKRWRNSGLVLLKLALLPLKHI